LRHELASGQWVDLRPIQSLRQRDKDVYDGAIKLFIEFDAQGNPDMSGLPLSMTLQKVRRNALFARVLLGWSFTSEDGQLLPVPHWVSDDEGIMHEDSIGDLPIDDGDEIWDLLAPYIAKCERRPDPKETTTAVSNGTSKGKAATSRKG
jgi:hypothetical protein